MAAPTPKATYILVNQKPSYLLEDIANAFTRLKPDCSTEVWCGREYARDACFPEEVSLRLGPSYRRSNLASRLASWIHFTLWICTRIAVRGQRESRFLFTSNPPLFIFLPVIRSLHFDCIFYDIYPNILLEWKQSWATRLTASLWSKYNRLALSRADRIFTITPAMRDAVAEYLPFDQRHKVRVVRLWADNTVLENKFLRDFRNQWELDDKKVVLYAGNLGKTHPLATLSNLAKALLAFPKWRLLVVTAEAARQDVRQLARAHGNIVLRRPVARNEIASLLSVAAWGCVLLDNRAGSSSVPSKTFNLLAAGVPLLAFVPRDSEIALLIKSHRVGICSSDDEIATVVTQISKMSDAERAEFSANATQCSQHFTSALAEEFVPP